jgi:hypothetical protein
MNPISSLPFSMSVNTSFEHDHKTKEKETKDHHSEIEKTPPKQFHSSYRDPSKTLISQVIINRSAESDMAETLAYGRVKSPRVEPTNFEVLHCGTRHRIYRLSEQIACRTRLSTTGYQSAMSRLNNSTRPDDKSELTLARAKEYIDAAKKTYPQVTLKSLAELQKDVIYRTADGKLLTAKEMSEEELTDCLNKSREHGFANCDIQALETGLHLWHNLQIKNFTIFSNKKMSHNYVVLDKSMEFPKGAIVDPWTGKLLQDMDLKLKMIFSHWESNLTVNKIMHNWIVAYGKNHVLDEM